MNKKRIALIGYGALSHIFLDVFRQHLTDSCELCGVLTRPTPDESAPFPFFEDLGALLSSRPDYVLEFAGGGAVREYGETVLKNGISLIIVSIGALADDELYARLREAAQLGGSRLHLPCGALGGLDVLRTMSLAGVEEISIENRKPPAGLNGAPYLQGRTLPEDCETQVFSGTAREAIAAFPHNVNEHAHRPGPQRAGAGGIQHRLPARSRQSAIQHRNRVERGRAPARADQPGFLLLIREAQHEIRSHSNACHRRQAAQPANRRQPDRAGRTGGRARGGAAGDVLLSL